MQAFKLVVAAAAVVLSGCGGGDQTPPVEPAIDGLWSDTNTLTLITTTGEAWTFGTDGLAVYLSTGNVATSGNSFIWPSTLYADGGNVSGWLRGTFVPRTSMVGTTTIGSQSAPFSLVYDGSYHQPPNQALATGSWAARGGGAITINGAGEASVVRDGCTYTARITPDVSGKNFFRVIGTFGPAPCRMPWAVAQGVLIVDGTSMGLGIVAGSAGAAFLARRI